MRLLLLSTVLLTACKKKAPVEPPAAPTRVEVVLQVVALEPDDVPVDTQATVRLFGAGLKSGVSVQVGPVTAAVKFISSNTVDLTVPALSAGTFDVIATNPDGDEATLAAGLTVGGSGGPDCPSVTVLFDSDASSLAVAARDVLGGALACYGASTRRARVEGHADERGTTEYNVALGQRRGEAVRRFLVDGGVAAGRLEVVSWGEEHPADPGHGAAAWTANRRANLSLVR